MGLSSRVESIDTLTMVLLIMVSLTLFISMSILQVNASSGGPLEQLGEMLGVDSNDSSSSNEDSNADTGQSTLDIPNITQRDEPPAVSSPSESKAARDQFALNAEFEPHENEFLADDNYWQMEGFGFNVTSNSFICPTSDCVFEFEDGQINTDLSGDWILTGRLKVGVESEEGTRSTLYDVRGEFDREGTLETDDKVTDLLGGEFRLGSGSVILAQDIDAEYDIINGTLSMEDDEASLILQGTKQ